jgi:hypothetical protein
LGCDNHNKKREWVGMGLTQIEIDLEFDKSLEEERV